MKKWKRIHWILCMPLLVALLIVIILVNESPNKTGISRAMAAKSVALAVLQEDLEDVRAWQKQQEKTHFSAAETQEWYVPYLDYLYENGYLSEENWTPEGKFLEKNLTYADARNLANGIAEALGRKISVKKGNQEKEFPEEDWWNFYEALLDEVDGTGAVEKLTLRIYGTPRNVETAPAWTAYTNKGELGFYGLAMDRWIDHQVAAYVRGSEIIYVLQDDGTDIVFPNVWITDAGEWDITVYQSGITRRISTEKKIKKPQDLIHNLADLDMSQGKIRKINVKEATVTGKVLAVNQEGIELEGYGFLPFEEEYQLMKTYGQVEPQKLENILVGYELEEFVVAKGKICAAITVREFDAKTIRVLLMTDGFSQMYHDRVEISWDGTVKQIQEDEEKVLDGITTLAFSPGDEIFQKGRVILESPNGEIKVNSLSRAMGIPSYEGRLEIMDTEQGLVLINDLYLEEYLKKVVPSEMPASYEKEALKAQAVCARTYAYMQIQSNTYSQYGAHVDDSTNFQVYNNIETDGKTAQAVDETYGEMLFYNNQPIVAYYFSTSCGITADTSVWGSDPENTPYLKAVTVQPSRRIVNVSDNEDFHAFIKRKDFSAYDSQFPFFRWNVTTNGKILAQNIEGVGMVTSLSVTERSTFGIAQKISVKGTEGEKTISGQNAIRSALGDGSLSIERSDGKTSEGWSSLPSGFLAIENLGTNDEGVVRFRIYGGGYGHGVGMSQNGAQGMAKEGMSYKDILEFFYDGISVEGLDQPA